MFKSIEKTALQEIGPRFTLKLKWLRKGLPAVTGGASTAVPVAPGAEESEDEDEQVDGADEVEPKKDDEETEEGAEPAEGSDGDAEVDEDETPAAQGKKSKRTIPPLNAQGEFEWQWKVRLYNYSVWCDDRQLIAFLPPHSRNLRHRARPFSSDLLTTHCSLPSYHDLATHRAL